MARKWYAPWRSTAIVASVHDMQSAIVAASENISDGVTTPGTYGWTTGSKVTSWQVEAARQYHLNGHLHSAVRIVASTASMARLTLVELDLHGNPGAESDDPQVQAILADFAGSPGKQAELIKRATALLMVIGDSMFAVEVDPETEAFVRWFVASPLELTENANGSWVLKRGNGNKTFPAGTLKVLRCWQPDLIEADTADSGVRGALITLRLYERMMQAVMAHYSSRVAMNPMLLLPQGLTFPTPGDDQQPGEDAFMAELYESITRNMDPANFGDASAIAPVAVMGELEALAGIRYLERDPAQLTLTLEFAEKLIRDLAIELDLPPSALLGASDSNDWSAFLEDETFIRSTISPLLALIAECLSEQYVRPTLKLLGYDETKYTVWYDTGDLTRRPNRSDDVKWAKEHDLLSDEATRDELGFTEDQAPDGNDKSGGKSADVDRTDTDGTPVDAPNGGETNPPAGNR